MDHAVSSRSTAQVATLSAVDRAARDAMFERVVVPEIDVLLRVARSITRSDVEAEDVVQDTLLRAYRSIDRFDGQHPRAWLLTILRNAYRNRIRRRRPVLVRDPEATERSLRDTAGDDDTADAALRGTFDAAVRSALAALSEPARAAVVLVEIDGLTCAEAAKVLGVAPGTVMSRLHRARAQMRAHLRNAGVEFVEDVP